MHPLAIALVFDQENTPFRLEHVSLPNLANGEVLVRTLYTTICTSDLHTFTGRRSGPTPCVLGHEIIGEVADLGSDTVMGHSGEPVNIGDRITWTVYAHDHNGPMARRGFPQKSSNLFKYGHQAMLKEHQLSGGFASHCHLKAGTDLFKIPESLSDQEATPLNCTHATVAGALRLAGDLTGKNVLVVGAGMIGLSACAMSAESGAGEGAVLEINPERAKLAADFGASLILDRAPEQQAKQLATIGGVDVVIETSGMPEAMEQSVAMLNIGGISVWVGAVFEQRELLINAEYVVRHLLTLKGLHNYIPADLQTAIDFLRKHHTKYPFHNLVAQTYDLKDLDEAFSAAENASSR
jgi:putative phosphonate catabolism associated alcohol dehydrogenase